MIAEYAIPFFFFVTLVALPLAVTLLCRWLLPRRWWWGAALACTAAVWWTVAYGYFKGFHQLRVQRVEYASPDLPQAFDGYRIVQFSDAHVGSLADDDFVRAIDSINALHPDLVVFTGDMVNLNPAELLPYLHLLDRIQTRDGALSVLGNHDYPIYSRGTASEKARSLSYIKELENRPRNWRLLLNEHYVVRRGQDSIVIGGMENWGVVERMPRCGDVALTLNGISDSAFVVMLQHDPTAWRKKILPECHAQLTLSGHTHGGQFMFSGWTPVALAYDEWGGIYYEGRRALFVSTGLSGLIPFRLGLPGEIVLITLRKDNRVSS